MNFFNTKIWGAIRNNKKIYGLIHNTIGLWIKNHSLRDRIKEMKTNGTACIFEIDRILSNANCVFFVDFGTLLGFIRDGKPLSWDYDIDYGICLSESFNWDDLRQIMNSHGFRLIKQFSYHSVVTEQTYRRNNIFVDFFSHFTEGDYSYYYIYYPEKDYQYEDKNHLHTRMTKTVRISDSRHYDVKGGSIHVPIEYESYLADVYGDDWKIPNPNWTPGLRPNITKLKDLGVLSEFEYIQE